MDAKFAHKVKEILEIRPAQAAEAGTLTSLALRSKAYWGYSQQFIRLCRSELTIAPADIDNQHYSCFVACRDDIVGFYAIEKLADTTIELAAMFVDPQHTGRGIGTQLLRHAVAQAQLHKHAELCIQSDPHAAGFYRKCGAIECGNRASSSIPGRLLPMLKITLG